jgi:hypothetical protein
MSYRSLRSVMFTSVSVWCITVRAIFGEGIRPIGKKLYLESIATCQILFSKFGLSKPPLPSTTTLKKLPKSKSKSVLGLSTDTMADYLWPFVG